MMPNDVASTVINVLAIVCLILVFIYIIVCTIKSYIDAKNQSKSMSKGFEKNQEIGFVYNHRFDESEQVPEHIKQIEVIDPVYVKASYGSDNMISN